MASPTPLTVMRLDHALLYEAERLANGANAHKLRTTMQLYVSAVHLVNHGARELMGKADHYEQELRDLVITERHAQARCAQVFVAGWDDCDIEIRTVAELLLHRGSPRPQPKNTLRRRTGN